MDNDEDDDELGESAKHFEYNLSDFAFLSFDFVPMRFSRGYRRSSSLLIPAR